MLAYISSVWQGHYTVNGSSIRFQGQKCVLNNQILCVCAASGTFYASLYVYVCVCELVKAQHCKTCGEVKTENTTLSNSAQLMAFTSVRRVQLPEPSLCVTRSRSSRRPHKKPCQTYWTAKPTWLQTFSCISGELCVTDATIFLYIRGISVSQDVLVDFLSCEEDLLWSEAPMSMGHISPKLHLFIVLLC